MRATPTAMIVAALALLVACGSTVVDSSPPAPDHPPTVEPTPDDTGTAPLDPSPTPTPTPDPTPTPSPAIVGGTITWQATTTARTSPVAAEIWDVSGRMDLVLEQDLGQFVAMPGRGTYAYDLEHVGCEPATHEEGTLETAIQTTAYDGIAQALMFGPVGADFELQVFFDDAWGVACPPGPSTLEDTAAHAFPGCGDRQGVVTAVHDGAGGYRIACDIDISLDNGGITVTGRIEGTLLPLTTP